MNPMRKTPMSRLTPLAVLALLACAADPPSAPATAEPQGMAVHARAVPADPALNRQLAELRSATGQFHDIEKAHAAGYTVLFDPDGDGPASACFSQGDAAMGEHYVHPALTFGDAGALDARTPEALIYEPMANGRPQLVAVEYVVPFTIVPAGAPAPSVLGQPLMENHDLQLWALHVWIWKDNPAGIFAGWNPAVSCQYSTN